MASLLSPRRTEVDLALRATTPVAPGGATALSAPAPRIGWVAAALAGALLCLVTGWLLVAGLAVLGWVAGEAGSLPAALSVGTRLWLTAHGVGVQIGALPVTLVPWGATALVAFLLSRCAAFAARSARPGRSPRPVLIALLLVGTYLVPVLVVALVWGRPGLAPGHLAAVVAVFLGAALHGSARASGVQLTQRWPAWSRPLPRAVLGSLLVLLTAGLLVLATGLVLHSDRVAALHASLSPGVTGTLALVAAQLALAPNAFAWSAAYALGGGFTLGNGSVVSPANTDLGTMPALPILGALPAEGPGSTAALWWLAAGVLAGVVAAWVVVRSRPQARFDETALVGGLSGVLGGLAFVGVAWASSGDLGVLRLAGLGPLLLPLLVMAVSTLGLAGMMSGLLLGLWRRGRPRPTESDQPTRILLRRRSAARSPADPDRTDGSDAEPTQVLAQTRSDQPRQSG